LCFVRFSHEGGGLIDWGEALKTAGGGFGTVIIVLATLSILVWVTGIVVRKMETKEKDSAPQLPKTKKKA